MAIGERYRNCSDQPGSGGGPDGASSNERWRGYYCLGTPDARNLHSSFSGSIGVSLNSLVCSGVTFPGFQSPHEGGVHFLLLDGAVRFVSENLDNRVRLALGTRNGKDTVGEF